MLTDENSFKPFLASPDAKKKEIINRFSGANKIDEVFPHLDIDITAKEKEINSVQLLINDYNSRQQLLTEQALAEEEKLNPDKINELGDQKKLSISNIEKQIESEYLLLDNLLDEKSRVDSKILLKVPTDFNKELDIKNFEKSALVSILETYKKELVECKDKFKAEIHVIILSEEKLKTDRQSTRMLLMNFNSSLMILITNYNPQ